MHRPRLTSPRHSEGRPSSAVGLLRREEAPRAPVSTNPMTPSRSLRSATVSEGPAAASSHLTGACLFSAVAQTSCLRVPRTFQFPVPEGREAHGTGKFREPAGSKACATGAGRAELIGQGVEAGSRAGFALENGERDRPGRPAARPAQQLPRQWSRLSPFLILTGPRASSPAAASHSVDVFRSPRKAPLSSPRGEAPRGAPKLLFAYPSSVIPLPPASPSGFLHPSRPWPLPRGWLRPSAFLIYLYLP